MQVGNGEKLTEQQAALADALRKRMEARGIRDMSALSVRAGLGRSFIRDVLVGRSSNPGIYSLEKVCAELRCTLVELLIEAGFGRGGPLQDEKLRTARLRALCWACWGDSLEDASNHLKVPTALLEAMAAGETVAGPALIERALKVTGAPAQWISEGRLEGMPPDMAARLGSYDLSLVRFDRDDDRR
jgi:transcriptional regulator with XRE-family HTH domain